MAKDNDIDFDWDDPFGGDFDLDMDFDMDPYAKKGFVGGLTSGFLSGIVDETVGSGQARMRTLRTVLPTSFSNLLDRTDWALREFDTLKDEFRTQNFESVKSLQSIAGHVSKKMESKFPGLAEKVDEFSQKDFSHWERDSGARQDNATMESVSDYDIQYTLEQVMVRQEGALFNLGGMLNTMSANVGGMLNGAIMAGNRQLVGIESGVRSLLDWQRNVQFKLDQAKLSLMAKNYVADVKFYKFMEKGTHLNISELRKIVKNSGMSDYQKTTTYTASKDFIRNKLFSTVGRRVGGLTGLLRERYGSGARKETYGVMEQLLGNFAEVLDMSSDMPMSKGSFGNMVGKSIAGGVINNAPYFFERGAGKGILEKLEKRNPKQAEAFKNQWSKLTNVGNRASYVANNTTGLVNYLAENYQAMDEMPFLDYEDYVDSLKDGQKPMPKARWAIQNAASNRAKAGFNSFMAEMTKARGTQYTMARRNVKDMNQPGIWKEMNNISLNEVIPGLLGKILQSTEGIRTGTEVEETSYSYMRGQFMDGKQKRVAVQADLMPYSDFSRYASAALEFVDSVDTDKTLSSAARKALAQQVAKDVDQEKGFNPFFYLGDIPGMSASHQQEVHAVMRKHFGIGQTEVDAFNQSAGFDKIKVMTNMPTPEGNERLNKAGAAAANLKDLFPNVAERIDLLRSTGNEQMLRDLGVIYTEHGVDKVNMSLFHERIGQFMDDPNNPALRGMMGPSTGNGPTRTGFDIPKKPSGGTPSSPTGDAVGGVFGELNRTIAQLTEKLGSVPAQPQVSEKAPTGERFSSEISQIAGNTSKMEALLGEFMEVVRAGKLLQRPPRSKSEGQAEDRANTGFINKLKGMIPGNFLSGGLDLILKNQPMVLGTLLGTLGASFIQNPLLAGATVVGGAMLGGLVQHWAKKDTAAAGEASDDEDILDEKGETILSSKRLKAGQYIDAVTKRVINTWKEIKGPIFDTVDKAVIGMKELAGKIFGPDGREVVLSGIKRIKEAAISAYTFLDPLNRIKSVIETGKEMVYQQDVYVKGEKSPRLLGIKFRQVDYWVEDTSGTFKPIKGWNEIKGPVYDEEGNTLISQADYDAGLVTSTGQIVRNVGAGAANLVGAVRGGAKTALDALLSKAGYTRPDTVAGVGSADRGQRSNGVEYRLDKIYALLSKQFGISVDDGEINTSSNGGILERLNSVADKARRAKEENQEKTNEAIQDIASELKGGKEEGKPDEKKGIFGKLMGMLGGIGTFGMNMFKNPIGTILGGIGGSLGASAGRLAKIGSMLFSGVLGVTSPIFKLMKWGFEGLAKVTLLKNVGNIAGGAGLLAKAGQLFGKLPGWGKVAGLAAGGAAAYLGGNAIMDSMSDGLAPFTIEPGKPPVGEDMYTPTLSPQEQAYAQRQAARDARDNAEKGFFGKAGDLITDLVPQSGIAKWLVESMGGVAGNSNPITSDDGKHFLSKEDRNRYEDERDGIIAPYNLTRDPTKTFTLQKQARFAHYGINKVDSELALRIDTLEQHLMPFIVIDNNRAAFRDDVPIEKIVNTFAAGSAPVPIGDIRVWFNARFKPTFLIYAVAASVAKMGDLVGLDANRTYEATQVVERVSGSLTQVDPYPLTIHIKIDPNEALLTTEQTQMKINEILTKMRKEYPVPNAKLMLDTMDERREKNLNPPRSDNALVSFFQDKFGDTVLKDQQLAVDKKFVTPKEIASIDISDLHKDNKTPMDALTFARLGIYGNVDSMPWRVDAVLKLERYTETLLTATEQPKFSGNPAEIFALVKPMFRVDSKAAESNWMDWFEYRFLPVLKRYVGAVVRLRGDKPMNVWKQLSDTNKAEVARLLSETMVINHEGVEASVWSITQSPFPTSKCGTEPDRINKYLLILDAKASEATLRDPEMEKEKSQNNSQRKAQEMNRSQVRNKTNELFDRVYGKQGRISGRGSAVVGAPVAGGWSSFAENVSQGGGQYNGTFSEGFNPDFTLNPGEDKGISMSKEQGDALMLNTMLKHGITDKRQLALGLAMARKETGDYQSTVENTAWSASTMKRLFRNVKDDATAQRLAALPPAQRAMYVYGQGEKGKALGNQKPEDGWLYRGRGFFQLTGRDNYVRLGKEMGLDLVGNPRLVSEDPNVMAETAVRFLKSSPAMMAIGQTGDFNTAVRGINGGNAVPATDQRRRYYQEYLDMLNNGSLKIPGEVEKQTIAGDDYGGGVPEASAPDVVDKKAGPKIGGVDAALAAGDTASKAKAVPKPNEGSPVQSASVPIPTTPQRTAASAPAPVTQVAPSPAPAKAPVAATPPAAIARPKQEPEKPKGPLAVRDEGMAQAMASLASSVNDLSKAVHDQNRRVPGVHN